MQKVLFAVREDLCPKIFSARDYSRIGEMCHVLEVKLPKEADKSFLLRYAGEAEIIITTWGTAPLDAEVMADARSLALLVHAAGSVKRVVSDALWERKVRVVSAAAAIGYGVAEFCLALMLMASKRAFWAACGTREGKWREGFVVFGGPHEIYQQKIGVIGAGHVGRHLIKLLRPFSCTVLLYDPYCPSHKAAEMGVKKVETLEEMFSQCMVVSCHAPATEETENMLRGRHFALLQPGAVFINTARAAVVNEEELVAELRKERFVACIDVTPVEPPAPDHPFRHLPNVFLTPHQAGTIAENHLRIGALVAEEIEAFVQGRPLRYEVTQDQIARIA